MGRETGDRIIYYYMGTKLILLCLSKLLKFDCAENLVANSSVVFLRVFKQAVRNKLK